MRSHQSPWSVTTLLSFDTVETPIPPAFDLSKYPKLQDVEICNESVSIGWILATLKSVKPKTPLRRVVVHAYRVPSDDMRETAREWRELDRLLFRLWALGSILPKVTCGTPLEGKVGRRLLPNLASRGAVYDHHG